MSSATGNKYYALNWTELSIDDQVINRVEEMVISDNQPIMTNGYTIFEWDTGVPIIDGEEDEN